MEGEPFSFRSINGPERPMSDSHLRPARPVRTGSTLAIVAPSGPFDREAFEAGLTWLKTRYDVRHSPDIFQREGYLAGSDEHRLRELLDAIDDPSVDAILCARGGFGATRILPEIPEPRIAEANKMIVGFCAITALHALWKKAGVPSVHAPMVAALGRSSESVKADWVDTLEHPDKSRSWNLNAFNCGESREAKGTLTGGNLAVLGALNGTPYCPDLDDSILFIEDVGERPYRIDRMLTTLSQSGWFDQINGLIIGSFTEGEPGPDGVSIDDVMRRHFDDAPFPVLAGFSAGHIDDNVPLPFGSMAIIRGEQLTLNAP